MSLAERIAGTVKGVYQSVFQKDRVLRLQRRTDREATTSFPAPFFDEGDVIEVAGLKAIYLGRDLKDPYQGSMLFFLEKQSDESPSLVTQRGELGKKTGRATPEQMDLVKEEIGRIIAKTKPSMSS